MRDASPHRLEIALQLDGGDGSFTAKLDDKNIYQWAGPVAKLDQHPMCKSVYGSFSLITLKADWTVLGVRVKR